MFKFTLWMMNIIDLMVGGSLVSVSIYLSVKLGNSASQSVEIAWIFWISLTLGAVLLFVTMLSFTAITTQRFRHSAAMLSCNIGIFGGLLSFVFALVLAAMQHFVIRYLENQSGLSSHDITTWKSSYEVVTYGLICISMMEILRYYLTERFVRFSRQIDSRFESLLSDEERNWQTKLTENKADRNQKYAGMKAFYKSKYDVGTS
jgi:hypothetical protein